MLSNYSHTLQKNIMRETQRRRLLYDIRDKKIVLVQRVVYNSLQARYKSLKRELYRSRFNKRFLKKTNGLYKIDEWSEWETEFDAALTKALSESVDDLNTIEDQYFVSQGKQSIVFNPIDVVNNYQKRVGRKIKNISKDTLENTQQEIVAWYHTDKGLPELVDNLSQYYDENRAQLIAETEVAGISSQVAYEQMNAYGITQWKWDAFMDMYTCPICQDLNGQIFDREDNDAYPPDSSHPRCRCGVLYVVDSPGGEYYGI